MSRAVPKFCHQTIQHFKPAEGYMGPSDDSEKHYDDDGDDTTSILTNPPDYCPVPVMMVGFWQGFY